MYITQLCYSPIEHLFTNTSIHISKNELLNSIYKHLTNVSYSFVVFPVGEHIDVYLISIGNMFFLSMLK